MKNKALFALLFSSVLLTGCMDTNSEGATEDTTAISSQESNTSVDSTTDSSAADEEVEEETVDYTYEVNPTHYAIQPLKAEANEKVALLTFDDAPDKHALDIAQILTDHDAPAIFFVNGMYLQSDEGKEALKTIHELGFEIGNHTHTHVNLQNESEEVQKEEILATSDLVEEIIGVRPRFFRAPFGTFTEYSREIVEADGMTLMNWTLGYDWEADYRDPQALADITIASPYLANGANILMHDRSWTKEALPDIIEGLRNEGYELLDSEYIQSPDRNEESTNE